MANAFNYAQGTIAGDKTPEMKLQDVLIAMMMRPELTYLTSLSLSMGRRVLDNPDFPIAATNGTEVLWNNEWLKTANHKQIVFAQIHESMHVANDTFGLAKVIPNCNFKKLNRAADFRINYDICTVMKWQSPPDMGGQICYDPKYDESWDTASIYADLPDEPSDSEPGQSGTDDLDFENAEVNSTAAQNAAVAAAAMAKYAGHEDTIPQHIKDLMLKLEKPIIDTKKLLLKYMTQFTPGAGLNFKKRNKRYPDICAPKRESKNSCAVAGFLDVSGSVTDHEIEVFLSEFGNAIKTRQITDLTLGQFDTKVRKVDRMRRLSDFDGYEIVGRGGTEIEPVIEWIRENKPRVCLIFSDGYFDMPDKNFFTKTTDIIWCIHNNESFTAPYGKVIHYGEDR